MSKKCIKNIVLAAMTVLMAVALMLCALSLTVAKADEQAEPQNKYLDAFERLSSTEEMAELMTITADADYGDNVPIPQNSVRFICGDEQTNPPICAANIFATKNKVVNMKKTVTIKWREKFQGVIGNYYIGLCSQQYAWNNPAVLPEFCFLQSYGTQFQASDGSTVAGHKNTFYSSSVSGDNKFVGEWDLGAVEENKLNRSSWYFYQLKIEYNQTTFKYDVTFSYEPWNGGSYVEQAQKYSVDIDPSVFDGGAYLFVYGNSNTSTLGYGYNPAPDVTLIYDNREGYLAGTSFDDWYHDAKVTTEEEFNAAIADTSVNAVECVPSDTFKTITSPLEINRSLSIKSADANGDRLNGTAGIIFDGGINVSGASTIFAMEGGAVRTATVDGGKATFTAVSLGYTADMVNDRPDHCTVGKNGAQITSNWSSLDISAKGAVKLEDGSTFVTIGGSGTFTWKATSLVAVDHFYDGQVPEIYCAPDGTAQIYAVTEGEDNTVTFEGMDFITYTDTDSGLTFYLLYSPIEAFEFDKAMISVAEKGKVRANLKAVTPEEPTNITRFKFASRDESVATVASVNGNLGFEVTGVKAGSTVIVVTTTDRIDPTDEVSIEIPVTVTAPIAVGFEIDASAVKKTVTVGEELDLSALKVYVKYDNGKKTELAAADYTVDISEFNKSAAGEYTVKVTYGSYGAQTFKVTVAKAATQGGKDKNGGCGCGSTLGGTLGGAALLLIGTAAVMLVRKRRKI